MGKNNYWCPRCKQRLSVENGAYLCANCNAKYAIEDGVANFRKDDFYWGVLEQDKLKELLTFAETHGWEKAVKEHLE